MAKIPQVLHEPLNTAFPANVVTVGSVQPDGFAQISPRGSVLIYDDETIAFWDRGHGLTHDQLAIGTKLTFFYRNGKLRNILPLGGIVRLYGAVTLIDADGDVREDIWNRMIEEERNRDPDKKGSGVLVAIERVEALNRKPLDI